MKTNYRKVAERYSLIILILFPVFVLLAITGCSHSNNSLKRMDTAESIIESSPDSALSILDSIPTSELRTRKEKARYALLKSIALDKNYIDTTTFDVLQPAIDYYSKHGTPDEKLKTYYYQGRIHQNANNDDLAMQAWLSGADINGCSDSLTLARLLVAEGILYHKQYKITSFIKCNLRAAEIYGALGKVDLQIRSYCHALNGTLILHNKIQSDSIALICKNLTANNPDLSNVVRNKLLTYIIEYGNTSEIKTALEEHTKNNISDITKIKLATGYSKIGEPEMALKYLDEVQIPQENVEDSLSYLSIRAEVLDSLGMHKESKESMKRFANLLSKSDYEMFSSELLFAEKKHNMDMSVLVEKQKRWNIIWATTCIVFILIIIFIIGLFRYRLTLSKKKLAEQELDNLYMEMERLEDERNHLSGILKNRAEMTPEMLSIIFERLDMLNSLLAKEITLNDSYARPLIDSIRKDRDGFLKSTRLAYGISHPKFMKYLESHKLTEEEINYVCLYAMGLRGKEIGEYIQLKRHYVMGSGIRKKLGIDEHETNLGPYIRKLLKEL